MAATVGRPPGATSAAYNACALIYREMAARSVPVAEVPVWLQREVPADVEAEAVFIGNLLPLIRDHLGMTSTETYWSRTRELLAMGCAVQLQRGTRYRVGAWALLRPPTLQLWDAYVARPFSHKRQAEVAERHAWAVTTWLASAQQTHPALVRGAVDVARVRTGAELLAYVATLPERRLRQMFPAGECCPGYLGGPHVCQVPGLDLLARSHSAGAWKRRSTHLAKLAAG